MTGDFFFSHFQHNICSFLRARPKHTCCLSHKSMWSSPDAAEVAGSEQWWPQGGQAGCGELLDAWKSWQTYVHVVGTPSHPGAVGACCVQPGPWLLAPGRKDNGRPQEIVVNLIPEPQAGSEPFTFRARSLSLAQGQPALPWCRGCSFSPFQK